MLASIFSLNVIQTALELGCIYALVALALFLSYSILNIADLSTDGCFTLGCAVACQVALTGHPILALAAAMAAGVCSGFVTAFLQTRLGVESIMAGIIVNTGLYTINLAAMGFSSTMSLVKTETIFSLAKKSLGFLGSWYKLVLVGGIIALACAAMLGFLGTRLGLSIRATGDNTAMVRASSINPAFTITVGLCVSGALCALSGGLLAQYQKSCDINVGTGMVTIALASLIIGETLVGKRTMLRRILGVVSGSCLYRFIVAVALRFNVPAAAMKLVSAIIVAVAISMPAIREHFAFVLVRGGAGAEAPAGIGFVLLVGPGPPAAHGEKLVQGVVHPFDHHAPLGLPRGHRPAVGLVGFHAVGDALLRGRHPQEVIEPLARPPLVPDKFLKEDIVLVGEGVILPDQVGIVALRETQVFETSPADPLPAPPVLQHPLAVAVEGMGMVVSNIIPDHIIGQKAQGTEKFKGGPGPVHRVAHHEKQLRAVVEIPGEHLRAAVEAQPGVDLPHQPGVLRLQVAKVAPGVELPPPGPVQAVIGGHPVEHGLLHIPGQGDVRMGGQQVKQGGGAALLKADAHKIGHPFSGGHQRPPCRTKAAAFKIPTWVLASEISLRSTICSASQRDTGSTSSSSPSSRRCSPRPDTRPAQR